MRALHPRLLAFALLLHALAHAGAGMWAAARATAWIVTPVWLVSMVGFLAAAFALFGIERLRERALGITMAATIASAILLRLAGIGLWSFVGLAIGIAFCALVHRWARCAHPEIHTPTFTTAEHAAIPERAPWRHRLGGTLAAAMLGVTALLIVLRPWHMAWGTSAAERAAAIDGLSTVEPAMYRVDHGVTIHAPATVTWQWLSQVGQDRAGFYSYAWLERALGDDIRNADSLVAAWQERAVGELVRAAQPDFLGGRVGRDLGWRITHWDPPRAMTLEHWGSFVVSAVDDSTSRLVVHTRGPGRPSLGAVPLAALGFYLFEPAHFIMERGMLRGIKARAERHRR
ncbi:MAG: hypothetical protein IT359_19125 [Gemmatimonadaceae bacterium]|nr:hypothetical protein [Gemmatimonadaceae bacterium]